jgi:hypothetical protein
MTEAEEILERIKLIEKSSEEMDQMIKITQKIVRDNQCRDRAAAKISKIKGTVNIFWKSKLWNRIADRETALHQESISACSEGQRMIRELKSKRNYLD